MCNEDSLHRRQPSVQDVDTLLARAQHLVDTRPRDGYPLAWCIEASYIGDLTAMAMVAATVSGVASPRPRAGGRGGGI